MVDPVPGDTSDGGVTVGPTPGGRLDGGDEAEADAKQRQPRTNKSFIISLTPTFLLFLKIYNDYVAEADDDPLLRRELSGMSPSFE
jgi:hypothetical protein